MRRPHRPTSTWLVLGSAPNISYLIVLMSDLRSVINLFDNDQQASIHYLHHLPKRSLNCLETHGTMLRRCALPPGVGRCARTGTGGSSLELCWELGPRGHGRRGGGWIASRMCTMATMDGATTEMVLRLIWMLKKDLFVVVNDSETQLDANLHLGFCALVHVTCIRSNFRS